jgi:branched-chain amino acid transport system substrate-binding protein
MGTGPAAVLAAVAARSATAADAETWTFGALFPFSGSLALLGDESFRGLDLATEERNAAGGVLGRQVRLVRGDVSEQAQAAAEAKRLIGEAKAVALFGTLASALAFAASAVAELAGVPYFELNASADPITERGFKYLFRSCPLASAAAALSLDAVSGVLAPLWQMDPATPKLAILHEESLFGTTMAGLQEARCHERRLNLLETLSYATNTLDFGSIAQRLRGSGIDVVLHTGYANDIVLFFRAMKQAGWRPRMVIGGGAGYALNDTAVALGQDFDGVMNVDTTQYRVAEAFAPGVGAVAAAYQRKYGAPPRSGHSLAAYAGAKLFYDAVQRAGTTDKDKVRAGVLAADVPARALVSGWGAKFDDRGQNQRAEPLLMQWQNGIAVTVWPVEAAVGTPIGALGH